MRVGLFVLAVFSAGVVAQQSPEECSKIASDTQRLACYDLNFKSQPAGRENVGEWEISKDINPIDDSQTINLVLRSSTGGRALRGSPVLFLRCKSNKTELYIAWNDYLGSDRIAVTTRIGDQEAETKRWSLSTDNSATFYPGNDTDFIRAMFAGDRLVAQTTPYNESPVTAVFNTTGLETAITDLRKTCGW